ncbi:MAG: recombinase family protein [Sphingomonadaceae bacterium]|jgi:site-specific DNA recombinase|nr:recombinase family protein [Sphingomonadaceae bacterium]
MSFGSSPTAPEAPKRAALYLRVSTGRQAAGEVSLPSQRELTRRYCEAQGWLVTEEYVEPGASATDDKRPVFQRMLEDARSHERRFDIICVHSFSRFYRNGAEMELTIRQLRKHGVEVVSTTQPTGHDPSQELMRQIIGIFDEYTSRENGKNVVRVMRESAKQGFWNGATPPLGYRIVEAERRGSKIKKKLDVDPVEAELVRLIFQLYLEGDDTSGPMGVKAVTTWLNGNGYRTRKGATFGIGPLHRILKNPCYATGKWPYGRRDSRTGGMHDPSNIIEIPIPPIISMELFEQVQARLAMCNPRVTPPRVVNGPTLLTGLAVCASCGSGMSRTGTRRGDKAYNYYSCAGCHQKGKSVCKGRHIRLEKLDEIVLEGVANKLLSPKRLEKILGELIERASAKDLAVAERRYKLEGEVTKVKDKLSRLYLAIEEGVIELDGDLKDRIERLKQERDLALASLERLVEQTTVQKNVTPDKVTAFSKLMREKIRSGDTQTRKAWLGSVISRIEVDDDTIRVIGEKPVLAAALAAQNMPSANVRGFVRKWRARQESNLRPQA